MNNFSRQAGNVPPRQAAIRAKCFHPTGAFIEFEKEEVEQSIPARFEKIVSLYPDRPAVKAGNRSVTYAELNRAANRVAWSLHERLGTGVEPVVLVSGQDLDDIASCFGILKAGKTLVLGDPSFPLERLRNMIANSQAGAIVTDSNNLSLATALANDRPVIDIDSLDDKVSDRNPGLRVSPDAAAQIVYSSGSTGQPKGIFFNHRRVLHDARVDVNVAHICSEDRIVQFRKLIFSAGTKGLFRALLSGATFFPYDIGSAELATLPEFLVTEGITIFSPGISIFRHFASHLSGTETFPSIRLIILGCEAISQDDIQAYKRIFARDCLWLHHLSSTEAGLVCQYFVDKDTELDLTTAPVGYPVEGKEIFLLDDTGGKVDGDRVGEIAVRSRYLSSGYWRNKELTDAKFLADPADGAARIYLTGDLGRLLPDGCLIYVGRKDFVVKVRGYSVDIGEIERALLEHPDIKEAGVVAWDRDRGEKYLAAYIVPLQEPAPPADKLGEFLKQKLPSYMIPSFFVPLPSLPLTNGKLDRKALPAPDDKRPDLSQAYTPPRNEVERQLVEVWAEILSLDRVGIHDDFFDLGGHSLAATRVVSQVIKHFQLKLPLQSLFQSPTIARMALVIAEHQGKQLGDEELDRMLTEVESMSDTEAARLVAEAGENS